MGKGSKAPAAPDPVATAQAQGAVNKETAIAQAWLNNMNQNTPYGSIKYSQAGTSEDGTPRFQSDITLSQDQQKILDNQSQQNIGLGNIANSYVNKIQGTLDQPFPAEGLPEMQGNINYGSLAKLPSSADEFGALADKTTNAMYSRLDPQFTRQEDQLRTRLANQGVMPGSEAFNNEFNNFNQGKNDAYQQAIMAGQQQANTSFNQSLAGRQQGASELSSNANFANNARQQGLSEQSYLRQLPINEYNALVSGQQVQSPQFQGSAGAGQMQAPNLAQLYQNQYQGQLNQSNANQAANNSMMSGLFGLGSAAAMAPSGGWLASAFSDRRLKTDIKKIGKIKGINIYTYKYKGSDKKYIGVIAQNVLKKRPEAVSLLKGYYAVDYGKLGISMREAS